MKEDTFFCVCLAVFEGASSGTKVVRRIQFVNNPLCHFIHPRICPLYNGLPSYKTKFLHIALSPVSPCASPWSVTLGLAPSVHLTLGVPFHNCPLEYHQGFSVPTYFLAFTLRVQIIATHFFSVTSNI